MYVQPRYCSEQPPIWLNPAPPSWLPRFCGLISTPILTSWCPFLTRPVGSVSLLLAVLCLTLSPAPFSPYCIARHTQGSAPLGSLSRTPTPTPMVGSRPLQDPVVRAHTPPYLRSSLHVHLTVWLFSLSCWRENFKSLLLKIHISSEIGFLKDIQKHRKRRMNKQGWTWEEI